MHHLRRLKAAAIAVPGWAWLAVASLLVGPWYIRYAAGVIGTCVEFLAPSR